MRLVVYLKCEHDHYGPHALDPDLPVNMVDGLPTNFCPGGGSNLATTADLAAALREEGGEKIRWCTKHHASIVPELDGCGFDAADQCDKTFALVFPVDHWVFPIPPSEKDTP